MKTWKLFVQAAKLFVPLFQIFEEGQLVFYTSSVHIKLLANKTHSATARVWQCRVTVVEIFPPFMFKAISYECWNFILRYRLRTVVMREPNIGFRAYVADGRCIRLSAYHYD